jgi:hypothetical protein
MQASTRRGVTAHMPRQRSGVEGERKTSPIVDFAKTRLNLQHIEGFDDRIEAFRRLRLRSPEHDALEKPRAATSCRGSAP